MAGVRLQFLGTVFESVFPCEVRQHLLDADGLGRGGAGSFFQPLSRLIEKTVFDHPVDPEVDAFIEVVPILRREADVTDVVAAGFPAGLGDLICHSVPRQLVYFKSTENSARIVRVQFFRIFGVDGEEPGVHRLRALRLEFGLQPGTDLGGVPRVEELQVLDEGVEVEAGAADEDDVLPPGADVRDDAGGVFLETGDAVGLRRVHHIDEVVRDALHLVCRRFRGGHVHAFVELHGVEGEDLSVQSLRQFHRQGRFARCRGADDRHQRSALSV